jgi:hypothetical protein
MKRLILVVTVVALFVIPTLALAQGGPSTKDVRVRDFGDGMTCETYW